MLKRLEAEYRSQITFTSDFHELVTGNLEASTTLRLSYDPQRIVPQGEPYTFGDPQRPVTACIRFQVGGPTLLVPLTSTGITDTPDRDATGQGSMLKAKFDIPAEAEMVSVWFSFTQLNGSVVYDSDFGANFNFRFPEDDVTGIETNVVFDDTQQMSLFYVHATLTSAAENVSVRFGPAGTMQANKQEVALRETSAGSGTKSWAVENVVVPSGVVIAFKLFYWIGRIRFKDDNTGHYYLSPPRPPENVPPPPPELARAALAWK